MGGVCVYGNMFTVHFLPLLAVAKKKKRKEKQFFIAFGDVLAAAAPIWNESLFIAYFEGQGNDPFSANIIEKIWQLNRA